MKQESSMVRGILCELAGPTISGAKRFSLEPESFVWSVFYFCLDRWGDLWVVPSS